MKNLLHTKIVATIGPASDSVEKLTALINAGVRVFRVNSSHGTPETHLAEITNIREAARSLNLYIPIILDLQGPKIRIGTLKEPMDLREGQQVVLKPGKDQEEKDVIPVDYPELFENLKPDEIILMDDGKIQLKIVSSSAEKIEAVVTDSGVLTSRKGINLPGVTHNIPSVTPRDIEYIKFAVENNIDYIALSFVRRRDDVLQVKKYCDIPVIAKIEKPEGVQNLNEILDVSDGVMVARGDLGIEISPERVPVIQKQIIKAANIAKKEVIVATQMLESMLHEPIPTRAEASDVANAIIDGADAIMLSGETAVGDYPVEAVKMMSSIAKNVEDSNLCQHNYFNISDNDSQIIANAVVKMLEQTNIAAVVACTRSGFTARLISKAKPSVPVIAISDNQTICDRLNLLWGVFPYFLEFGTNFTEEFLLGLDEFLVNHTFLKKGDKIVITGGMPSMSHGMTNFVRIHQV